MVDLSVILHIRKPAGQKLQLISGNFLFFLGYAPHQLADRTVNRICCHEKTGNHGEGGTGRKGQKVKVGGVSSYMVSSRPSDVLNWEYYVYYDMNQGQFVGARLPVLPSTQPVRKFVKK